ncbi:DUF3404 domain-containing protein [Vibrio sp. T187]|nr:DUF3404 domain-containing protein [Vibrio sp. T187]
MYFRRFIFLLLSVTSWHLYAAQVQDQWQQLYQQSWEAVPLILSQQELSKYPTELIQSNVQFPGFERYSWQDIKQLHQVRIACALPSEPIAHLKDAIEFELKLCRQQPINDSWFLNKDNRHPAGGSFVERYLSESYVKQSELVNVSPEVLARLTAGHSQHPLSDVFSQLSNTGRDALISGYRAWLTSDALWLNGEQGWKRVSNGIWQPLAKQLEIDLNAEQCDFRYSNLCIAQQTRRTEIAFIALIILSTTLLFLFTRALYQKRQQSQSKRFVLQLLTHELRTPIASLGLTVEQFKAEFDHLNENSKLAMWRLLEDYQRLTRLTEASKGYLNNDQRRQYQSAKLEDWLDHICTPHDVSFELDQNQELKLPYYWLSICVNNLIINAKRHGAEPIHIKVTTKKALIIRVYDDGHFPTLIQRWRQDKTSPNHDNMGIGLNIVRHLMHQLGGKLKIQKRPTCLTLELPL